MIHSGTHTNMQISWLAARLLCSQSIAPKMCHFILAERASKPPDRDIKSPTSHVPHMGVTDLTLHRIFINIPNSFLVQTHRRTVRSFGFTLRARPRNLPSHIHCPGSADTREDRRAAAGRAIYSEVFSTRAVSQPINIETDNNSCERRKAAGVRRDPKLLVTEFMFSSPVLHAQIFNPDCKKCSLKHYFNTQHHSNSLPHWFCRSE